MEIESEPNQAYLDNYKLVKTLGQGYTAKVKLGINPDDGKLVALKIFKKTHAFEKNKDTLTKEFEYMKGLDHPNLLKLIAVKPEAQYKKKNGETYNTMAIVLEYAAAGELFEYVSNCGRFSEDVGRTYFHQMLSGLEYLHNQGICHRDMKPENLLYNEDFILKVADFGFATAIAGKDGDGLLRTILGTESYMCPEIHQKIKYNGPSNDLFASAIILFILLTGHPPFMKADPKDPYYKLLINNRHSTFWKAHSKNKPGKDAFFSQELQNLFNTMFAFDPSQRASLEEIKAHAWYNGKTKDMPLIKQEFLQRQQVVEQQLEEARQQKLAEKAKQQGDYVFAGVGKFRSVGEVQNEFAGLETKYSNLNNKRTMKNYNDKLGKQNDFFTVIDPDYLLKKILSSDSKICKEINLKDDVYKMKCLHLDSNGVETRFSIEFLRKDNDVICIDFKKLEGCSIAFFNVVDSIKNAISGEKQVDAKVEQNQEQAQEIQA